MAASGVTYDGVPSAQGGNIFKDIKFWVSHRVPQRPAILGHITSNGGVIKPLEKDADMLIADCARKDAPADSYSWKFITDSIAKGIIQLEDRYCIGVNRSEPRPARPGRSTKSTRTPFTLADDVSLARWVLSFSGNRTGNAIYLEFEGKNSRHTWQSWRNRYMKALMPRGEDSLRKLANQELPAGDPEESRNAPRANQGPSRVGKPSVKSRQDRTPGPAAPRAFLSSPAQAATRTPRTASPIGKEKVPPDNQAPPPASPETREDDGSFVEIQSFYDNLHMFREENNLETQDEHKIGRKIVGLWELSAAALKQDVPRVSLDDVDWSLVAKDLGYDPDLEHEVPFELRQCFEANLAEFCEAMESFDGDADESDQVSELASPRQAHRGLGNDLQSSPLAQVVGRKRSLDSGPSSSGRTTKRRRGPSRDVEIPATPEDKVGFTDRRKSLQTQSPSIRRNIVATVEQARGAGASRRVPSRPSAQHADERAMSTERGAGFESQARPSADSEAPQDQDDMTPSQQLHFEEFDSSPIPLHMANGRSDAALEPAMGTPRPRHTANAAALTAGPQANTKASRRSLPASFGAPASRALGRPADESAGPHRQFQAPPAAESRNPPREGPKRSRITEHVEYYESLGYSNHIVVEALKRTSMTPGGLAPLVMQSLKDGQGVPTHHQGVWTDRDDKGLRMVDNVNVKDVVSTPRESRKASKELARLTQKHGLEGIQLRRLFLEADTAGED
ncbi:rap1 myb domain-containing protein [Hirsutella rhossiliensis]|uniref:DNA-binding protein RAP1 n=1 Tax=Hirsutella rhossiliensis TaxID=111463 RepID=A0A9P8MNH7_9HYPO|nr:rap1 myb domain-containing protein [Hirsutella rhossiliensis]KAH0958673.1 rap1 myb domain-containing protein [Hirsutella rhossiliensis]